ncbi:S9 family peptidase, partial [Streptomyces sp. NPDC059411]
MIDGDPNLWLEDLRGEEALAWVQERNAETAERLTTDPGFPPLSAELREVLDDEGRIPYVRRRGKYLYDFRQDAAHVRGVWRRTVLDEYRLERPAWETVLDLDALAAAEGREWVWAGAEVLRPGYRHALVQLSLGGSDAVTVREFDLETLRFVEDGFQVDEAKTQIGWIDADHVYVGTDLGPGSLTASGYPRTVRRWRRGTQLAESELVFEGAADDLSVGGWYDPTEGYDRHFLSLQRDFWHRELFLLTDGNRLTKVDVPDDAEKYVHRQWLLVVPKTPWSGHPAGSLLAFDFEAFLGGNRE